MRPDKLLDLLDWNPVRERSIGEALAVDGDHGESKWNGARRWNALQTAEDLVLGRGHVEGSRAKLALGFVQVVPHKNLDSVAVEASVPEQRAESIDPRVAVPGFQGVEVRIEQNGFEVLHIGHKGFGIAHGHLAHHGRNEGPGGDACAEIPVCVSGVKIEQTLDHPEEGPHFITTRTGREHTFRHF